MMSSLCKNWQRPKIEINWKINGWMDRQSYAYAYARHGEFCANECMYTFNVKWLKICLFITVWQTFHNRGHAYDLKQHYNSVINMILESKFIQLLFGWFDQFTQFCANFMYCVKCDSFNYVSMKLHLRDLFAICSHICWEPNGWHQWHILTGLDSFSIYNTTGPMTFDLTYKGMCL